MSLQVEVVGLPVRESAVGADVDELALERRASHFGFFEPSHFGKLVSRSLAASCDSRAKSSQLFVEFGIGHAAHSWDLPMLALCAAASIHASRCR